MIRYGGGGERRCMGHVTHGEEEKYSVSVGKPEGKRIFVRLRFKWVNDVKR